MTTGFDKSTLIEKTDQQLLQMIAHPIDYVPEAVEAAKEELHRRNVDLGTIAEHARTGQAEQAARPKTHEDFLKVLSPASNCPCMRCGEKGRTLRFRRLRFSYGFLYWIRTRIWTGYICDACAAGTTLGCILGGCASLFLIHPQAFFWTPLRLTQNLWNTFVGFPPHPPVAFESLELEQGVISPSVAKQIAGKATALMAADPTQTSGPILGAVAILSGYTETQFIQQVHDTLLSSHHRSWGKAWVTRIDGSLNK
jgi:hypothetical protein